VTPGAPGAPRSTPSFIHVDLDAFYASVEQLLRPELRGRPVIVGGTGPRGVVAAASYEARAFGVRSAMPTAHARRRCPQGVFLAPRFDEYERASRAVMAILRAFTPLVEQISLDEAFLDVDGARRLLGEPAQIGAEIRRRIRAETGLAASVGAATTKFLAKLASEDAKPDGLLVVVPGTEPEYLHPLPAVRLWGVGPATMRRLDRMGVRTIGDLARTPVDALAAALGRAPAEHLHALARNVDPRPVQPARSTKSVGHEETFPVDITDRAVLAREVVRIGKRVGERLRHGSATARTVTLKVRYADFRTVTRSRTLAAPTDVGATIAATAQALLDDLDCTAGVRLLGVSGSGVAPHTGVQTALDLDLEEPVARGGDRRRAAVERAADGVRARFGRAALRTAGALRDGPATS
jgi:DNA polymerase-4